MNESKVKDLLSTLGIKLSREQEAVFWDGSRNVVMAGGEGSGKSFLGSLLAVCRGITEGATLGWCVGGVMEDANKEMSYIIQFTEELGILDRPNSTISTHADQKQRLVLRDNIGSLEPATFTLIIESVSGHDPANIAREDLDFIIGCEVPRWEPEVWRRCQGRLLRLYPDSWGFFSGSFKEAELGWFLEVWQQGQGPNEVGIKSFSVPSWSNPVLYPGGADHPAIVMARKNDPPAYFLARYAGLPTPPKDAVLPEFKNTLHVYPVAYDPGFPVYVAIDPATNVYAVLFVQAVRDEIHVLDEVYLHQVSHEQIMQAVTLRPLWTHVREGVIDVAGTQHHFGLASAEEAWRRDTEITLRAKHYKLPQTVERLRSMLAINPVTQRPRLLTHPRCKGLISELGGGPSPIPNGGLWRNSSSGFPRDDHCDAAKALGYWALTQFGTVRPYQQDFDEDEDTEASYMVPTRPRSSILDSILRQGRYG